MARRKAIVFLMCMCLAVKLFYCDNKTYRPQYTRVDVQDKANCLQYRQFGTHFSGADKTRMSSSLRVCDLFYFDSDIIKEASSKFLGFNGSVTFWLLSPTLVWYQGAFITTFRITLKTSPYIEDPLHLNDAYEIPNYVFVKTWDSKLNPLDKGKLLGLAVPTQETEKGRRGHHDTRLFLFKEKLFAFFTAGVGTGWVTYLFNFEDNQPILPAYEKELMKEGRLVSDKNWVPILTQDSMYVVRNLDPMHVMKCEGDQCNYVYNQTDPIEFQFADVNVPLRGGTPFVLYEYPYYLSVSHAVFLKDPTHRYYTAHFTVVSIEPNFRLLYVSDALQLHQNVYKRFNGSSFWKEVEGDFIFPTALVLENPDQCVFSGHVNDIGSVLLRFRGIGDMMRKVIQKDRETGFRSPDPLSVQNHLLQLAQTNTLKVQ